MAKVGSDKTRTIAEIPMACADEDVGVAFLEDLRWGDTPCCPRCGDCDVYQMQSRGGGRERGYRWRCRGCKQQHTVRTGTVMEDSRIPLRTWCHAYWRAASSKKGVSALQIKRETGISYKSALFLMHRIRWAMSDEGTGMLDGQVEADETYVGPRGRRGSKPGRSTELKTPVFAAIQRDGEVRARVVPNVTGATLKAALRETVLPLATIYTDEFGAYSGLAREFAGHETVSHKRKEYVRGDATTNTAESFFAILKRGVIGTFHSVSKKHLHRYVSEFEFKWNTRHLDDGARMRSLIRAGEGKRLFYRLTV